MKKLKLTEYYKNNVLNRAMLRVPSKKGFLIFPRMNYLVSASIAIMLIFVFSSIDIKNENQFDDSSFFDSEILVDNVYEYLNEINQTKSYELSDYYKNLNEEEIVEIFQEMDSIFNNESSYLIENIAGNTDF